MGKIKEDSLLIATFINNCHSLFKTDFNKEFVIES